VAVKSPGTRQARRRRTPQDARQEILDAARELIAERPFHEVTVLAIMERTTLSRKSFYVYFRDHSELIIALVRPLRAQADASLAQWAEAADPVRAGRAALRAAAGFYRQHGTIMRALFWASGDDPDLAAARRDLTEPVIDAAVRAIGPIAADPDPRRLRATVRALVTMNVHSMLALPADATDADLDQLTDTLAAIWERVTLPDGRARPVP
jgi:AcrR family transcriptional regulator